MFDYLPAPPAAALADMHIQADTFDVERCVTEAKKLRLTGVMTLGTDQPVYTAACIAKTLGLPSLLDEETAFAVTNKAKMKKTLAQASIPIAEYQLLSGDDAQRITLEGSLVLKPADSQGQRGVLRVYSREEGAALFPVVLGFSRVKFRKNFDLIVL